jgi:DNA (cytosine-5)-methyltransferase 1
MSSSNSWQHRKADTDEERFGLLDRPTLVRYKKMPIFTEPQGELPSMRPLTALGVTSGVGSMMVGCHALGFKVVGNIEWRDYYRYRSQAGNSTFTNAFPGAFMARGLNDVPSNMMPGSIDFALGHPECGRFSSLSHSVTHGNGDYQATRGSDASDIPLFLKMIAELRPRFFLMDDLPAAFDVLPMSEYVRLLPDYDLFPEWISNWAYGNVQKYRNRMFIVGALKSENFAFVPGEEEHTLGLKDVIEDLLGIKPGELANVAEVDDAAVPGRYTHMRFYGDRCSWKELKELFQEGEWGKNLKYYAPDGTQKIRPGTNNPSWEGHCPVLSGGYNPLHPVAKRPLTIRERARIQGFPDDFVFYHDEAGPMREVWEPYSPDGQRGIKQTGKAMPIQFCTYVAAQVKAHIEKVPFESSHRRVLKPNPKVTQAKEDFCRLSGFANQRGACENCWHREACPLFLEFKDCVGTDQLEPVT